MQNSKIKAIIFDLDGVIIKAYDEKGGYLWSRTIKKDLGLRSEHFAAIFSAKWEEIIRGTMDLREHLESVFQEKLFKEIAITPEEYIQYWLAHDHHVDQDMLNLVNGLNLDCYLGTNQESVRTSYILNTVGPRFKGCFASYTIGFIKPEWEFFHHIQNTLSLCPHELLLIDDVKENVDGAQQCGWHAYHYQNDRQGLVNFLNSRSLSLN